MDSQTPTPEKPDPQEEQGDWIDAAPSSHLKSFRFLNRAFSESGKPSVLEVTFRSRQTKKGETGEATYSYESHDHLHLRMTFERMTIAEHPGEILHAELISQGNRGTRIG